MSFRGLLLGTLGLALLGALNTCLLGLHSQHETSAARVASRFIPQFLSVSALHGNSSVSRLNSDALREENLLNDFSVSLFHCQFLM
jgi:hypothetical protein